MTLLPDLVQYAHKYAGRNTKMNLIWIYLNKDEMLFRLITKVSWDEMGLDLDETGHHT